MADVALGAAGSAVGSQVGGTVLGISAAQIGGAIGAIAGSVINQLVIYPALFGRPDNQLNRSITVGAMAGDATTPSANYGTPLPIVAGPNPVRLSGTLAWADQIREQVLDQQYSTVSKSSGGKGGGGSSKIKTTTFVSKYEYFGSFAFVFCVGPVTFSRLWANGKLISSTYVSEAVSFYPGDDIQTPDSIIEAQMGIGNTPAFRNRCYVVFRDVNLDPFGNRIPELQVEVIPSLSTLSSLLSYLFDLAGITNYTVDASIDTIPFRSIIISDTLPAVSIIQSLADIFGFFVTESDGILKTAAIPRT